MREAEAATVVGAHVVLHLRHPALELGEVGRRELRHGDPDRDRLERDSHDVELLGVGARQLRDPDAAVRLGNDQPLPLEQSQRLAQRRAAHVEVAPERHLRRRLPGRQLAAQDRVAQAVVHERHVLAVARAAPGRRALHLRTSIGVSRRPAAVTRAREVDTASCPTTRGAAGPTSGCRPGRRRRRTGPRGSPGPRRRRGRGRELGARRPRRRRRAAGRRPTPAARRSGPRRSRSSTPTRAA
jgi:hypothetical protein